MVHLCGLVEDRAERDLPRVGPSGRSVAELLGGAAVFDPEWTKSSYSSADGGNCVEWAKAYALAHGAVPVRDSKDPSVPGLMVGGLAWSVFLGSLKEPS
ncbi:DUF397 domain-containing protein [Streptomyces albidoflavus]